MSGDRNARSAAGRERGRRPGQSGIFFAKSRRATRVGLFGWWGDGRPVASRVGDGSAPIVRPNRSRGLRLEMEATFPFRFRESSIYRPPGRPYLRRPVRIFPGEIRSTPPRGFGATLAGQRRNSVSSPTVRGCSRPSPPIPASKDRAVFVFSGGGARASSASIVRSTSREQKAPRWAFVDLDRGGRPRRSAPRRSRRPAILKPTVSPSGGRGRGPFRALSSRIIAWRLAWVPGVTVLITRRARRIGISLEEVDAGLLG